MEPQAPKQAPAHIPVLDGWRGLLTFMVLIHHVVSSVLYSVPRAHAEEWRSALIFAHGTATGLPMYFVISGWVIYLPAARHGGSMGSLSWYAVRRVARIVPAYYLNLAVLLFAWPFLFPDAPSPMASQRGVGLVLGHLAFLQKAIFYDSDIGFGLNGSVWTLTLEEFFYATIPLVALAFFRHPYRILVVSLVVSIAWRFGSVFTPELANALGLGPVDPRLPGHLFYQFPGYVGEFGLGAVAALIYVRYWGAPFFSRTKLMHVLHVSSVLAIAAVWTLVGFSRYGEWGPLGEVFYDMLAAVFFAIVILVTAMGPEGSRRLYDNAVCRFLGDTSYGVYLWHMVLIQVVFRYGGLPQPPDTTSLVLYHAWVIPGSLLLGWVSFRFVERPISQWARRVWKALQQDQRALSPEAT